MAEDLYNPLTNPDIIVGPSSTKAEREPEVDEELSQFLDEIFEDEPVSDEEEAEVETVSEVENTDLPEQSIDAEGELDQVPATPAEPSDSPSDATNIPTLEDLQRDVLERLSQNLERSETAEETAEAEPTPITPEMLVQHYAPRVQELIGAGWIGEDHALNYPVETAIMAHLINVGGQMQQGINQTQEYVAGDQQRREADQLRADFNSVIDSVAGREGVFTALSKPDVRQEFEKFLLEEANITRGSLNPDYVAKQFYAFSYDTIGNTIKQQLQPEPSVPEDRGESSLTQQERNSSRQPPPAEVELPDFYDLLEGTEASQWYTN